MLKVCCMVAQEAAAFIEVLVEACVVYMLLLLKVEINYKL